MCIRDRIITWTAAFNGGQAAMKGRVITEDLSANPILELKHRDPKTGGLLTDPVKVYEGKWENGKIVKANDTPVIKDRSEFTDVADQGFKFTVPDKYANTIPVSYTHLDVYKRQLERRQSKYHRC